MQVVFDGHLHTYLSEGVSKYSTIDTLNETAKLKGLNLITPGDVLHPTQLKEARAKLTESGYGIYSYRGLNYVLTTEIENDFRADKKSKRIHSVVAFPSFHDVEAAQKALTPLGKGVLTMGRPQLHESLERTVGLLRDISPDIVVIPAHSWTPWFGIYGQYGFDSINDALGKEAKHIFALESGLSCSPIESARMSEVNERTLVSFSDAHSAQLHRVGREATVLELDELAYVNVWEAIRKKSEGFFTIEVPPQSGRYHFSGHINKEAGRGCEIIRTPEEIKQLGDICPKCGRKLTKGVATRIEELADTEAEPQPHYQLLPLDDLLGYYFTPKVKSELMSTLLRNFQNEYNVLLNASVQNITAVTNPQVAKLIQADREQRLKFTGSCDGVYGTLIKEGEEERAAPLFRD